MASIVAWLDEGPDAREAAVAPILEEAGEDEARRAFLATQNREERQRSSVYTTAETILASGCPSAERRGERCAGLREPPADDYRSTTLVQGEGASEVLGR